MSEAPRHRQTIEPSLRTTAIIEAADEAEARAAACERLETLSEFLLMVDGPVSGGAGSYEFGYDAEQIAVDGAAMCQALLDRMGIRARVSIASRNGLPLLDIHAGRNGQLVIGRNGQNIDAIQTLVNRMLVRGKSEINLLPVDCEDYLERHRQRLTDQANRAAEQVMATGSPLALPPMNAADRKMIHNLLATHEAVKTASEGEGPDRHVVVLPR